MSDITYYDLPEELRMEFRNAMDDDTLRKFYLSTKDNMRLCDEIFWLNRIAAKGLNLLLPFRSFYKSLPEFYFNIVNDAYYVVANIDGPILSNTQTYNNIALAHKGAIDLLRRQLPTLANIEELKDRVLSPRFLNVIITVFIRGQTISSADIAEKYTIWSTNPKQPQFNCDISHYPLLTVHSAAEIKVKAISYITDDEGTIYSVRDLELYLAE